MEQKAVLVTGGAGYVGSHVCKALARKGFLPVAYDNLSSGDASAAKWGPLETGDVRNRRRLAAAIRKYKPVAVIHMAALPQDESSDGSPAEFYDNNVFGSFCLLEEMRAHDLRHIVFSSTAEVYGVAAEVLVTEDHPLNPSGPFGSTKLAAENLIRDYAASYGFHHAILRCFSAAGADPEAEAGMADAAGTQVMSQLLQVAAGQSSAIQVSTAPARDYVHVTDLADAYVRALEFVLQENRSVTLNLGTGMGHTADQIIAAARDVTAHPLPVREGETLVADAGRARTLLGWQPQRSDLDHILRTAWNWHRKQNVYTGVSMISNDNAPRLLAAAEIALKGLMDRTAALVALIFLAPIFAVIGAMLKIEGQKGSVFYGGQRVGRDGKLFRCWKFRTMAPNSDHLLHEYLEKSPEARAQWEEYRKLPDDPRVQTRTAKIIRKLSIDELPQLWNVLRGEMSLVGPRPILEDEKHYFGDALDVYCSVRPGVTGLWQVSGRNEATFAQRVDFDLEYISNWSLGQDLSIMVRTVGVLLDRKGAY